MYEVFMRLRFDSPCLGNVMSTVPGAPSTMPRGPDGNVTFSQTWWRTIVCQGAESYGKHQNRVKSILWTAAVDGTPKIFRRHYSLKETDGVKFFVRRIAVDHEAFLAGDVIGIKALVPDDVPLGDLRDLMGIAGEYFGISPFGWKKGFGKFKVLEVTRITKAKDNNDNSNVGDQGQPHVSKSGDAGCEGSDLQAGVVPAPGGGPEGQL